MAPWPKLWRIFSPGWRVEMLYAPETVEGDGSIASLYCEGFSENGGRNFLVPGLCIHNAFQYRRWTRGSWELEQLEHLRSTESQLKQPTKVTRYLLICSVIGYSNPWHCFDNTGACDTIQVGLEIDEIYKLIFYSAIDWNW